MKEGFLCYQHHFTRFVGLRSKLLGRISAFNFISCFVVDQLGLIGRCVHIFESSSFHEKARPSRGACKKFPSAMFGPQW